MAGYIIKVTLENTHPPVWRRIEIPERISFFDLHCIIQEAFGWEGYHLYDFSFPGTQYRIASEAECMEEETDNCIQERLIAVDSYLRENRWIRYTYDFGDNWEHKVVLEKIDEDYDSRKAVVLKIKGENFEEDCGGVWSQDDPDCRYPVAIGDINKVLDDMSLEVLEESEDEFESIDEFQIQNQIKETEKMFREPQENENIDQSSTDMVISKKIEKFQEFWEKKQDWEEQEKQKKKASYSNRRSHGQKVVSLFSEEELEDSMIKREETEDKGYYIVKGKAKKTYKEVLKGQGKRRLKDFCKYLQISYKKNDRMETIAALAADFLLNAPVYFLYVVDFKQYQDFVGFCQRGEGICKKNLPKKEEIEVWMQLGIVELQYRKDEEGEYLEISPIREAGQMIDELKKKNLNNEYKKIQIMSERLHACIRLYGLIELEAFYDIYCELYGKEWSQVEFMRFLYWHESFSGKVQTVYTQGGKRYVAPREQDVFRALHEQKRFAQDIDYIRLEPREMELWKSGFMEANSSWWELSRFLNGDAMMYEEEFECWVSDLYAEVTSGISCTELIGIVLEVAEIDEPFDWIQLWQIAMSICLTTNLTILKGHSRLDYYQLTGSDPFGINMFDACLWKKKISKKAHLYELPVEVQIAAFLFFGNIESGAEPVEKEVNAFFLEKYEKNEELTFLYMVYLVEGKRYKEAKEVLEKLKKTSSKENKSMRIMENEIEKNLRENKNVIYPLVWGGEPYRREKKVERNAPCPCGSGKKYKHCCMNKDNGI